MSCGEFRMSLEEDKGAFISENFVSSCPESTIWDKLVLIVLLSSNQNPVCFVECTTSNLNHLDEWLYKIARVLVLSNSS